MNTPSALHHRKLKSKNLKNMNVGRPTSNLFSSFPPAYLSPSSPAHLRKLFLLNGGYLTTLQQASVYLVSGSQDVIIPTLYMEEVVLYDCAWIEESFLRGKVAEVEEWVIFPWQYTGPAEWIPLELFDGLPEIKEEPMDFDASRIPTMSEGWGAKERRGAPLEKHQVSHLFVVGWLKTFGRPKPQTLDPEHHKGYGDQDLMILDDFQRTRTRGMPPVPSATPSPSPVRRVNPDRYKRFSPYKTPKYLEREQQQVSRLVDLAARSSPTFSPVKQGSEQAADAMKTVQAIKSFRLYSRTDGKPLLASSTTPDYSPPGAMNSKVSQDEKQALNLFQFPRPPLQAVPTNIFSINPQASRKFPVV
jgi:hypothetical protein